MSTSCSSLTPVCCAALVPCWRPYHMQPSASTAMQLLILAVTCAAAVNQFGREIKVIGNTGSNSTREALHATEQVGSRPGKGGPTVTEQWQAAGSCARGSISCVLFPCCRDLRWACMQHCRSTPTMERRPWQAWRSTSSEQPCACPASSEPVLTEVCLLAQHRQTGPTLRMQRNVGVLLPCCNSPMRCCRYCCRAVLAEGPAIIYNVPGRTGAQCRHLQLPCTCTTQHCTHGLIQTSHPMGRTALQARTSPMTLSSLLHRMRTSWE